MTALSVNLNKVALLRNARGGGRPDVAALGRVCLEAGAAGLTLHRAPTAATRSPPTPSRSPRSRPRPAAS